MQSSRDLTIGKSDFERLMGLVNVVQTETSELLEEELERAQIVPDGNVSGDVVKMNSLVSFLDESTNKEMTLKLVYPEDLSSSTEGKVSILAPIGAALIGLRVGQKIDWPLPNGRLKTLKVISVKNL